MSCLPLPTRLLLAPYFVHRSLLLLVLLSMTVLTSVSPVHAQADPQADANGESARIFLPLISNSSQSTDVVDTHTMDDYALAELARQRNEAPFQAPEARATGPLNQVGQWGPVVSWPFAFATAANLPDGRIIVWGANNLRSFTGGSFTYSSIWNPATGQFQSTNRSGHSMFCAIPTMMEDGRVFVNGGDGDSPLTSIFDYRTNQWSSSNTMNTGRWYPGTLMLPGNKVFTMLGRPGGSYPELWTPNSGWKLLTGANLNNGVLNYTGYQSTWLPYLHLAPDGRIFHTGPTTQMNWIDPGGNGSIASAGLTNSWYPKYSAGIMYDEGKLLFAGGAASSSDTAPGTNKAMVIDISTSTARKTNITPMTYARKFNNGVVLPNGEVMIIGGNTSGVEFSDQGTILTPEIWNPTTQSWRSVADHSVPRNYHSVALLMTDGRVWSGGGGLCNCSADHPDHQVYSPPYLFNADGTLATRPVISSAPATLAYGARFTVQASTGIQKFSLIKMSGVTHNLNSDVRYLSLPFTSLASGQYELTLRNNLNVLTPGYWMLFALNSQGVPSLAKVINISSSGTPRVTTPDTQGTVINSSANLRIIADDPNGDPLTFSATGLPTGLTINSSTGVIAGTVNQAGVYRVTVTVSDGTNSVSVSFDWYVNQPGSIRFVRLVAESEVNGNPWSSAAEFNVLDGNGNPINRSGWKISADSEEVVGEDGRAINAIDGNTNTIWHTQWQAASPIHPHWLIVDLGAAYNVGGFRYLPRQGGTLNGTIAAYKLYLSTDGVTWSAAAAQGTFANNNTEKSALVSANQLPTLANPGSKSNLINDLVNLTLSASDGNGDPLKFSATDLPAGLTINTNTGVISGRPTTLGGFATTVTAADPRGGITSVTFQWTISSPNFAISPIVSTPKPVNTAVSYSASTDAIGARYKWLFGDGTAESAYSASATINHSFAQPGRYVVKLTVIDSSGTEKSITFAQSIHLPLTANRPAVSMNIVYEVRGGGDRVWSINEDNDSVSVFNATTNSRLSEIGVGNAPRSLTIAPNGRIWVTNKGAATISIIDPSTLTVVQTINLPYGSQPIGIAASPTGDAIYVVLEATGRLVRFNPSTAAQTGSVNVGVNVRHLSIAGDGRKVYVSRFITPLMQGENSANPQIANGGGEVVVVDTTALSVSKTVVLRVSDKPDTESGGRGLPNYLGPLVLSPDGVNGWVPSKQDNIQRGGLRDGNNLNFQNTVRAISSRVNLSSESEVYTSRIDHDNAGVASSGSFDRYGNYLFVALETNRAVAVVDGYSNVELFRIDVGRAPQGLTISPDGLKLYVNNFMDRTISVIDLAQLINEGKSTVTTLATLNAVTTEKLSAQVLAGKQFFYDAKDTRLALDSYISCASCHNDGGQDGRVWDLTGFGEGLRNTISLQGRSGGEGFLHWSGNFDEVQDFEGQIRSLAGGTGLMSDAQFNNGTRNQPLGIAKAGVSADLDALAAYVQSLNQNAASPYRNANGSLTADGAAGKSIFENANCAQCHGGTNFTSSGNATLFDIGTLKPSSGKRLNGILDGIDPPTLRDVWATAPYLHDGSAATLADAVRAHNNVTVGDSDLIKLAAYLQQIGREESGAGSNRAPLLTSPGNRTNAVGDSVSLVLNASDPDGDTLTFSATGLPTGLNVNSSSGTISGSPTAAGTFNVTIAVSDNRGLSASVTIVWTVSPVVSSCGGLQQEAELGRLTGAFVIGSDSAASGGKYIYTPKSAGDFWNGAVAGQSAEYCFSVTTAGTYRIKTKVYGADSLSDSFYVQVDGAPSAGYLWDVLPNTSYALDYVNNRTVADPVEIQLSAGEHRVNVFLRESGTRLDTVALELVSNTPPPAPTCAGLVQEAETGVLSGAFALGSDNAASGGNYIYAPNGSGDQWNGPNANHKAEFCFNVAEAGTYEIRAAVYAADDLSDSFYVQVDQTPVAGYLWDVLPNTSYLTDSVSDRNKADPVQVVLSAGLHRVTIYLREDGARLDMLELVKLLQGRDTPNAPTKLLGQGLQGVIQLAGSSAVQDIDFVQFRVVLTDAATSGQKFRQEVVPDRNGAYHFDGMLPGDYVVTLQLPSAFTSNRVSDQVVIGTTAPTSHTFVVSAQAANAESSNQIYLPLIGR